MNTDRIHYLLNHLKAIALLRAKEALSALYEQPYEELSQKEKGEYRNKFLGLRSKFFPIIQIENNLISLSRNNRLCISVYRSLDARNILLRDMEGGEPLDQKLKQYKESIERIFDESGNETNIDFYVQKVHASKYCSYYWLSVKQSEVK